MREDLNPKPRLMLIEAWDRDTSPDAPLDLLTRALVDPDAAVRERAQSLFERRLATHRAAPDRVHFFHLGFP